MYGKYGIFADGLSGWTFLDKDEDQTTETHQQRIEAIGDNVKGRESCEAGSSQKLSAVGDESLSHRAEHIKERGTAARCNAELLADILGNWAGHNDGNGIVGCAEVDEQCERRDTQLAAFRITDAALDEVEDKFNAAVFLDESNDAGHDDRNNRDVIHGVDACANMGKHFRCGEGAGCQTNEHAQRGADNQDNENVDAADCTEKHDEIGNDLKQVVVKAAFDVELVSLFEEEEESQRNNSSRQDNLKVFAEFVTHIAALRFDSGDGGIRDDGQVITKHCAADNGSSADSHRKAGFFADTGGDRRKRGYGANGGTHRDGNKAADDEKAGNSHSARQDGQAKVDSAFYTAGGADSTGEGACCEENQAHGQNIFVACALRRHMQLLHEAELFVLHKGHDEGYKKADDGWHTIKVASDNA